MSTSFISTLFSLLLFISPPSTTLAAAAAGKTSFRPKALLLRVSKDPSTLQYLTHIHQRTPSVPLALTLDLGGKFLWVNCEKDYISSTYRPIACRSAACSLAAGDGCITACFTSPKPVPGCNNNTCAQSPVNTVLPVATSGELASDSLSIQSTDGINLGRLVSVPNFIFDCGATFLLKGLARGVKGMAGLGWTKISLSSQLSSTFKFPNKFGICLSSASTSDGAGVVIFGNGPYKFRGSDVSRFLTYTPLIRNPDNPENYFIGVTSIKFNQGTLPINKTLLSIDKQGRGGTMISTVKPYTVLETSIYNAIVKAMFSNFNIHAVSPFKTCFNSKNMGSTRLGPAVPQIDLVLHNEVSWTIHGGNSVVSVGNDVSCFAFLDGGKNPATSIVIGAYQLENNFVQFDLAASRLGFTGTLLFSQTHCGAFNFTSTDFRHIWVKKRRKERTGVENENFVCNFLTFINPVCRRNCKNHPGDLHCRLPVCFKVVCRNRREELNPSLDVARSNCSRLSSIWCPTITIEVRGFSPPSTNPRHRISLLTCTIEFAPKILQNTFSFCNTRSI